MDSNPVNVLDWAQIGPLFRRARTLGEGFSFLEKRVAEELLDRFKLLELPSGPWLDLGRGEGALLQSLRTLRDDGGQVLGLDLAPTSGGLQIAADAHSAPFRIGKFGAVVSNLFLPWCDAGSVFREVRHMLQVDGVFLFSTFGPATLGEMRKAWAKVDRYPHVHPFLDLHDLGDLLLASGFSDPVMDVEILQIEYGSLDRLLFDLKQSGWTNLARDRRRTLTGKGSFSAFRRSYLELADAGGTLTASFEVVYGYARAPTASVRVSLPE